MLLSFSEGIVRNKPITEFINILSLQNQKDHHHKCPFGTCICQFYGCI